MEDTGFYTNLCVSRLFEYDLPCHQCVAFSAQWTQDFNRAGAQLITTLASLQSMLWWLFATCAAMPLLGKSLWPVCALPCKSSEFSLILLCTHDHNCYRGSGITTPLLSLGRLDFTFIRVHFRVQAGMKMERMPRGARILSNFSFKPCT